MILVTGGAGFIGSHAVVELLDSGYEVAVIDSLENGYIEFVDKRAKFYQGNVRDEELMNKIFSENSITAVMHFAGYIKVGESVEKPDKYYHNNTYTTLLLLQYMKKNGIKNIIFSSTAAVYGEVQGDKKVDESFETKPINPYGKSKFMAENIIIDMAKAYGFNYAIFRYFNVAGAHEKYEIGQKGDGVTALISLVLKKVKNDSYGLEVYGDDYPTVDGTGVRDYIHVVDLVRAHILAIKMLEKNESGIFNLGNGNGFSVLEIIKSAEKVTGKQIDYKIVERRPGDPASVVASAEKAREILGWQPEYVNINRIVTSAWDWVKKL
ncbi:UDP-glucose 4-epimerase GalE [Fusobacterium hominis]|uniref:UDP-glucose 4-epimerase GalE n=1 Tax=Fusobacterium hominis TaxID=2764326 RepID=UPI0022E91EFB|nr:UDP-glucose 4-epimerase GalE [Fusobacterium hominis]